MKLEQIKELFRYNKWANQKILEAVFKLPPDDYICDLSNSFGSVRDTLVHILGCEKLWLSRWLQERDQCLLDAQQFPTINLLKNCWQEQETSLSNFVNLLNDDRLLQNIRFTDTRGSIYSIELWKQMLHMINHSTYHRGQIVTMIRQTGLQPPSTDLIYYYLGQR